MSDSKSKRPRATVPSGVEPLEALVVALGGPERRRGAAVALRSATERAETLLRSARGRALSASEQITALAALADAYDRLGETDAARRAHARWVRRCDDVPTRGGVRNAARERAFRWAHESCLRSGDPAGALKWGLALAEVLAAQKAAQQSGAHAAALEPLGSLALEVGQVGRAVELVEAWAAAEALATEHGNVFDAEARRLRIAEARARAALAAVGVDPSDDESAAAERAALAWVEAAHGATARANGPDVREFALVREREARELLCAVREQRGTLERADFSGLQAVCDGEQRNAVTAAWADWCAASGDWAGVLEAFAPAKDGPATRPATEQPWLARAWFCAGKHAELASWNDGAVAEAEQAAEVAALCAISARAVLSGATEGARDTLVREELRRARRGTSSRGAARPKCVQAVALARQAWAEHCDGLDAMAQTHAREAWAGAASCARVSAVAVSHIAWMYERVGAASKPRRGAAPRKANAVVSSARALAALDANDTARAARHLAGLDDATLAESPEGLAHTLAAAVAVLERWAPDDPGLAAGRAARLDFTAFAVLVGERTESR